MTGRSGSRHQQPGLFGEDPQVSEKKYQEEYAVMHCDGASRGNPGRAGIGAVIVHPEKHAHQKDKDKTIISEYIGIATNNVAEYTALIRGLETARSLKIKKIKIYMDSELLVRQLSGVYKVRNNVLLKLWSRAVDILKAFESYKVTHVRREMNKEADALAAKAADMGGKS